MTVLAPPDPAAALIELPLPTIWLDGVELPGPVVSTLGSLRIRQEASTPAVCELELDWSGDLNRPAAGTAVRVRIEGSDDDVFAGEVVAVSHRFGPDGIRRLRLRCFDRSHRLRQTSSVTAHTEVTVGGLLGTLAGRHALSAAVDHDGPTWPRVIQRGESDLELIGRLAADAGLWWQLDGAELRLRRWAVADEREATWGVDLYEAVVDADATATAGSVRTSGWDPVARKAFSAEAGSSDAGSPSAPDDRLGGDGAYVVTDRVLADTDHAEGLAQSELDGRAAAAMTVRAVVRGDRAWRPGVGLRIAGQTDDVAGPYLLTAVEHLVDPYSGYVCVLSSTPRRRASATPTGGCAFTMAKVVDIEDADLAGRVKVTFPTLDDAESEWLPVVSLGAGEGKGLLCQPDVGDTVLVLYASGDPGRGVVLGGLFADHLPGDAAGVADRAVRRFGWNTVDGQKFVLNRDGDQITLANAAGSTIEITADAVRVHAAADLTIEAPGKKMILRADTIDFERG